MTKRLHGILIALALLGLTACGGDKKEQAPWPEKPADGTPVVVEFVALDGEGKKMSAKMRVFNFSDKAVSRVGLQLDYLDAQGKKLKDFPWSQQGMPQLVGPKGQEVAEMGAFLPPETAKVMAKVELVEFKDGSKWAGKAE